MEEKIIVDITPDKSLIQKLGNARYRTVDVISELLANSIDARITGKIERIDVVLDYYEKVISISDNGSGMNLEELKDGLTIARDTKIEKGKLGKFGLRTSACSTLGKEFTITTSKPNSDFEYSIHYDEEKWLSDSFNTWENFEIKTRKKIHSWHGTIVRIGKLNVPIYPNQSINLRKTFEVKYGPYIKSEQISLFVNTRECESTKILIQQKSKQELDIKLTDNHYLKGWIGLLEKRSIKGDYGIHLYKNNRLIKAYDKFGIRNHPKVTKIIGELHLDHVPTNFHKTGFIEESLEYTKALKAFRTDSKVIKILQNSTSKSSSEDSIQDILNYFTNNEIKRKLKTRINDEQTKILLNKADSFDVQYKTQKIEFDFENRNDEELYKIQKTPNGIKIIINKQSPIFSIIGNPLFLIGLIELEAKIIMNDSDKYEKFLKERNIVWNKFVQDWSEKQERGTGQKSSGIFSLQNYSLVNNLEDLHEFLKEKFEFNFKFTALSTLEYYLQNAYNKMIYHIHTEKNAGQSLYDLIIDYNEMEFTVILNPKTGDIQKALEYSEREKFIIIREYSKISKDTWASPGDAWIDLFLELKRESHHIHKDELENILDYLLDNNLTDKNKLEAIARHKNVLHNLKQYFGDIE